MSRFAEVNRAIDGALQRSLPARKRRPHADLLVPVSAKAVLHVRRSATGAWQVSREGGSIEGTFPTRIAAIEFARLIGMAAGSYRAYYETKDGSTVEERFIPH
jgi:hypothetical protein